MRITQYPPHLQSEVWQIFWVTFGSHTAKWPKPLPHKMLSKVWQNHEKIAIYWRQGMPPSEKIRSHNPEVGGSSPPSATNNAHRKRYRCEKPRNHNGFGVLLCHFLKWNSKDIISLNRPLGRTWTKTLGCQGQILRFISWNLPLFSFV